ncbi:MAG: OmpH family outer membrane protein [Bacteroidales bacterium]
MNKTNDLNSIVPQTGKMRVEPEMSGKTRIVWGYTIILTLIFFLTSFQSGYAQRFAYVDSDYILNNIPEYLAAQEQLDKLAEEWQKEIEASYEEVEALYSNYQQERVLMSDEMRRKREDEIVQKEAEAAELQSRYFGPEGELYQNQEELIRPIQDRVYNAVEEMANDENYAVIFDTANSPTMLYTNPRNDLSDDVLERLGYGN